MALTKYTKDTAVIENVGTKPEDRTTLNDLTFKQKWDENATDWKTFFNNTTSAEIDALITAIKGAGWTSESLKGLAELISTHTADVSNPHAVTALQAGALPNTGGNVSGSIVFTNAQGSLNLNAGDTGSSLNFDFTGLSTASSEVRAWRTTNTSGAKQFRLMKGDGTNTQQFSIVNGIINVLNGLAVTITAGAGSPEGAITANVGSIYLRSDGSTTTTLYVKTSGTGNTGWTAK